MKQVIISILMTILMSLVGTKVYAFKVANSDGVEIEYEYIKDGAELAVGQNLYLSGSVVIPEEVTYMDRTRKVTAIGESAFHYCPKLVSITIPNSVTTIGRSAFYQCKGLTTVTLSNKLESIGDRAFCECSSLSSITIPNSVTSIGDYAFENCI